MNLKEPLLSSEQLDLYRRAPTIGQQPLLDHIAALEARIKELEDVLRNVEEEMRLLSWQKSIELRRPAGSFGIAVKNDPLALEWQEVDAQLQSLYVKRHAALSAAPQPKGGE